MLNFMIIRANSERFDFYVSRRGDERLAHFILWANIKALKLFPYDKFIQMTYQFTVSSFLFRLRFCFSTDKRNTFPRCYGRIVTPTASMNTIRIFMAVSRSRSPRENVDVSLRPTATFSNMNTSSCKNQGASEINVMEFI